MYTPLLTHAPFKQVLLFHPHTVSAAGDALVDLVDYCAQQITLLNSGELQRALTELANTEAAELKSLRALPDAHARAAALAGRDPGETLRRQEATLRFQTAVAAVGVLRCLCAQADAGLPLPALARLLQTHDLPLALVPLVENPPWTRRREAAEGAKGATACVWEKYVDFTWHRVPTADLLLLTKCEAQPWLALFHLLASPRARARYPLHSFRKGQLLRVRRYLHEALLDQLPVLADVRRFLDEAALLACPDATAAPAALLLEEVAALRAAVLAGVPQAEAARAAWCEQAAARQLEAHFASHGGDARDQDLKALAGVYGPEWADAVLSSTAAKKGERVIGDTEGEGAEEGGGPCGHCGQPAAKRCGQCQKAWYCGRDCQVAAWKRHRRACRPAL
jgi:hypothetical protein